MTATRRTYTKMQQTRFRRFGRRSTSSRNSNLQKKNQNPADRFAAANLNGCGGRLRRRAENLSHRAPAGQTIEIKITDGGSTTMCFSLIAPTLKSDGRRRKRRRLRYRWKGNYRNRDYKIDVGAMTRKRQCQKSDQS